MMPRMKLATVDSMAALTFEALSDLGEIMSPAEFHARMNVTYKFLVASSRLLGLGPKELADLLFSSCQDGEDPVGFVEEVHGTLTWLRDVASVIEAIQARAIVALSQRAVML